MQTIKEITSEFLSLSASQLEFRNIQNYTSEEHVTQLILKMHSKIFN
jgi:hypothetical protein